MRDNNNSLEEGRIMMAEKICAAAKEEFEIAVANGTLKNIPVDKIDDVIGLIRIAILKNVTVGLLRSDINGIIAYTLFGYIMAKKEPSYMDKDFVYASLNVDIPVVEGEVGLGKPNYFISNPKYMFGYVGPGPFCIGYEGPDGIPTRYQYLDEDGNPLENPIVKYFFCGNWVDKKPEPGTVKVR